MFSRKTGIRIGIFSTVVGFLFAEPWLMLAGGIVILTELAGQQVDNQK